MDSDRDPLRIKGGMQVGAGAQHGLKRTEERERQSSLEYVVPS